MASDLIVFAEDWGGHPSSTQHLVRHLAAGRRVVWVNSIGLRRPRLTAADLGRAARKVRAALRGDTRARVLGANTPFPVVQPLALPMARSRVGRWLNRLSIAWTVRPAAAALNRPIVWAAFPSAVQALGSLGEAAVVYYCGDDFGVLPGVDHAAALAMEAELADRADLILAASPAIAERFSPTKTRVLPHGVDLDHFTTPVQPALDLPGDGPVAGFFGTISAWLDLGLLVAVAARLPQWRFVLVGPVATDVDMLRAMPNIRLLGPRAYAELPSYAQHWTASLCLHGDHGHTRATNPLKLREYLAVGRPVVATPCPALEPYRSHIELATGADAFADALEAAREEAPERVAARRAAVAGESWATRAATAAALIEALPALGVELADSEAPIGRRRGQ